MEITIDQIKELRERTGAGVGAVKEALEHAQGDNDKAIQYLREKGLAKAAKRAGKQADNGTLGVYVHGDNRMVVVVEVASETDFAARSEDLKKFANDIALHIAANEPLYTSVESIPENIIETEKATFAQDVEGKPAEIAEKIIAGKLEKFYADTVITHQQLFTDETKTVQDYMNELVAKVGEKIEITRFVKMKIAAPASSCGLNIA
jgi:elongation factor Ts